MVLLWWIASGCIEGTGNMEGEVVSWSNFLNQLEATGEQTWSVMLVLHIEKSAILLCHIYRPPYSAKSLIEVLSDVLEQENTRS